MSVKGVFLKTAVLALIGRLHVGTVCSSFGVLCIVGLCAVYGVAVAVVVSGEQRTSVLVFAASREFATFDPRLESLFQEM